MPYITKHRRSHLHIPIEVIDTIVDAGELNYLFTELALGYIYSKGKSYQHCNDVVGALTCAKEEFYRRMIAPYEDEKIKQNGDVYPTGTTTNGKE